MAEKCAPGRLCCLCRLVNSPECQGKTTLNELLIKQHRERIPWVDRAAALADASSSYMVRCVGGEFPEMFEKAMLKCEALRIFFQINSEQSFQSWDIVRLIDVATLNYEWQARALIEMR